MTAPDPSPGPEWSAPDAGPEPHGPGFLAPPEFPPGLAAACPSPRRLAPASPEGLAGPDADLDEAVDLLRQARRMGPGQGEARRGLLVRCGALVALALAGPPGG